MRRLSVYPGAGDMILDFCEKFVDALRLKAGYGGNLKAFQDGLENFLYRFWDNLLPNNIFK